MPRVSELSYQSSASLSFEPPSPMADLMQQVYVTFQEDVEGFLYSLQLYTIHSNFLLCLDVHNITNSFIQ